MDKLTAAALDRWLTTEPEYPEIPALHCEQCGGFLKRNPTFTDYREDTSHCNGRIVIGYDDYDNVADCGAYKAHPSHTFIVYAWNEHYRKCSKCGKMNIGIEN